jgi:ABC-2 type transport system permease protein
LVSERERGLWRHYRTSPLGSARLLFSTLLARMLILLSAGALQLGVAMAVGMTVPDHPAALALNFFVVSFAFIGLGFVIAGVADNIPAVQALGQCVFLPMLILGGIAVPLSSLPMWAQHISAFLPGRYSVEILQAATNGALGLPKFPLVALTLIGALACFSGAKLFRWSPGQHFRAVSKKSWLLPTIAAWIAVGAFAESRERVAVKPAVTVVATKPVAPTPALAPWEKLTDGEIYAIPLIAPADEGLVSPIARDGETPDEMTDLTLAKLEGELPHWPPALVADPVQRARNLLSVAAVVDLLQNPVEKFIPPLIQARVEAELPHDKAVRLFAWIALHPDEGTMILDLSDLHLEGVDSEEAVRERAHFYAIKLLARLTGRKTVRR